MSQLVFKPLKPTQLEWQKEGPTQEAQEDTQEQEKLVQLSPEERHREELNDLLLAVE